MTDRLDMSLDALMDQKKAAQKASNNNNNNKKSNKATNKKAGGKEAINRKQERRAVPYLDRTVDDRRPKSAGAGAATGGFGADVFNRLGGTNGCTVSFKNLSFSVSENDVLELCKAIGKVSKMEMGKGKAEVCFANRNSASQCCSKYNGLSLDGRTMTVEVKQEAPQSVFSRIQGAPSNVREGIFGTAMDNTRVNLGGGIVKPTGASFTGGGGRSVVQSTGIVKQPRAENNGGRKQQNNNKTPSSSKPQQRNTKKDHKAKPKGPAKPEDLDADLDAYMGKSSEKVAQEKAKSLDDDLDSYMAARSAPVAAAAVVDVAAN